MLYEFTSRGKLKLIYDDFIVWTMGRVLFAFDSGLNVTARSRAMRDLVCIRIHVHITNDATSRPYTSLHTYMCIRFWYSQETK